MSMRALTQLLIQVAFEIENIKLTSHLPYSPDLASNDFYLFPSLKNKLRGQRFKRSKCCNTVLIIVENISNIPQIFIINIYY